MIQHNLTTLKPLGIKVASSGPLSRPKNVKSGNSQDIAQSTLVHFNNVIKYIESQQQVEEANHDVIPGMDVGFATETGRWSGIILPRI